MRIRNDHREAICQNALSAQFDPLKTSLEKEENLLGIRFYERVIPESERKAAAKLPRKWVERTRVLRFSADGAPLSFTVDKEVVVPVGNSRSYGSLGVLDTDCAKLAVEYHSKLDALKTRRRDAEQQLRSMLASLTSLKQLEDVWPEGKAFYAKFVAGARLPTPTAKRVNEALGLRAA